MMADEIIEEVWRIKDEIAREHGYDVDRLGAYFRERERQRAQRERESARPAEGDGGRGRRGGDLGGREVRGAARRWKRSVGKLMESDGRRRLEPSAPEYPAALRQCFGEGRPGPVTAWGTLRLLEGALLGFFCSVRAPGDVLVKTYDLARALRSRSVTVIGGFQSPMEKEFLDLLLRGAAGTVVCPARGLGIMRLPRAWRGPLGDGRLLVLSFFDEAVRRPTAAIAARRKRLCGGAGGSAARGARGPGGQDGTVVPGRPGGRQAGIHAGVVGQRPPDGPGGGTGGGGRPGGVRGRWGRRAGVTDVTTLTDGARFSARA